MCWSQPVSVGQWVRAMVDNYFCINDDIGYAQSIGLSLITCLFISFSGTLSSFLSSCTRGKDLGARSDFESLNLITSELTKFRWQKNICNSNLFVFLPPPSHLLLTQLKRKKIKLQPLYLIRVSGPRSVSVTHPLHHWLYSYLFPNYQCLP